MTSLFFWFRILRIETNSRQSLQATVVGMYLTLLGDEMFIELFLSVLCFFNLYATNVMVCIGCD